jgi:hypothetical protein
MYVAADPTLPATYTKLHGCGPATRKVLHSNLLPTSSSSAAIASSFVNTHTFPQYHSCNGPAGMSEDANTPSWAEAMLDF